jgi:hypothetical protein
MRLDARRRGGANIGNIRPTSNAAQPGCSVRRMQAEFHHGLLVEALREPRTWRAPAQSFFR